MVLEKNITKILQALKNKKMNSKNYNDYLRRLHKKIEILRRARLVRANINSVKKLEEFNNNYNYNFTNIVKLLKSNLKEKK